MGYTATTDRATGYVPTATDWNILEDNSTFLYGDTGWTNISSFTNSYTNFGGFTTRYILLGRLVYVQGAITGGTPNTVAFTLPSGYQPTQIMTFAAVMNSAFGQLQVNTSGQVTPITTGTSVNIDICFPVV